MWHLMLCESSEKSISERGSIEIKVTRPACMAEFVLELVVLEALVLVGEEANDRWLLMSKLSGLFFWHLIRNIRSCSSNQYIRGRRWSYHSSQVIIVNIIIGPDGDVSSSYI